MKTLILLLIPFFGISQKITKDTTVFRKVDSMYDINSKYCMMITYRDNGVDSFMLEKQSPTTGRIVWDSKKIIIPDETKDTSKSKSDGVEPKEIIELILLFVIGYVLGTLVYVLFSKYL